MIVIAGASRMSSVRGLNASPHSAIVRPLQLAEVRLHLVARAATSGASFTASTARRILKS